MIVLGIESSCDETGVALVETIDGRVPRLLSNTLHSQIRMHQAYGGVVPELASRDHVRRVLPLLEAALSDAALAKSDIDVVAFTRGPGLGGAPRPPRPNVPRRRARNDSPAVPRPRARALARSRRAGARRGER